MLGRAVCRCRPLVFLAGCLSLVGCGGMKGPDPAIIDASGDWSQAIGADIAAAASGQLEKGAKGLVISSAKGEGPMEAGLLKDFIGEEPTDLVILMESSELASGPHYLIGQGLSFSLGTSRLDASAKLAKALRRELARLGKDKEGEGGLTGEDRRSLLTRSIPGSGSLARRLHYIHAFAPRLRVLPILLSPNGSCEDLDALSQALAASMPSNCLYLACADFPALGQGGLVGLQARAGLDAVCNMDSKAIMEKGIESAQAVYTMVRVMEACHAAKLSLAGSPPYIGFYPGEGGLGPRASLIVFPQSPSSPIQGRILTYAELSELGAKEAEGLPACAAYLLPALPNSSRDFRLGRHAMGVYSIDMGSRKYLSIGENLAIGEGADSHSLRVLCLRKQGAASPQSIMSLGVSNFDLVVLRGPIGGGARSYRLGKALVVVLPDQVAGDGGSAGQKKTRLAAVSLGPEGSGVEFIEW